MEKVLYRSSIVAPRVSVVLLDWSVRESLHSLTYLNHQRVSRDDYELIWIEFYDRRPAPLMDMLSKDSPVRIDQWIVLDMPKKCYYHKHMMYNIGIAVSRGDIVCICDSDAMFSDTFISTLISTFAENDHIVLHLDEVRNNDKKFYPFSYPDISEVLGPGAINWQNGKTTGLLDTVDPLHTRNYGACFCAKREDLIEIGGADEDIGFVGHVCGPYEMTFRLVNNGFREVWHEAEYIYHVWHPGQAGDENLVGPHDGRHISTIALDAAKKGRVMPLRENAAIAALREYKAPSTITGLIELAVDPMYPDALLEEQLERTPSFKRWQHLEFVASLNPYRYNILRFQDMYYAVPWDLGELDAATMATTMSRSDVYAGGTEDAVRDQVRERVVRVDGSLLNKLNVRSRQVFRKVLSRVDWFLHRRVAP